MAETTDTMRPLLREMRKKTSVWHGESAGRFDWVDQHRDRMKAPGRKCAALEAMK